MAQQAAIVTGGSSGIGFAIAEMLLDEGYGVTLAARRPEKLEDAVAKLGGEGREIAHVAGNMGSEEVIQEVVRTHRERFGRLDVLVNNAGVGFGAPWREISTKRLDMQLDVNLRAIILFYRECVDMLKEAAGERGSSLVVNTSSISGKSGEAWLSVYSATKAGVVGFTEAMNKEIGGDGVKSCALCPAFVDTPMTDFVKESVAAEDMIRPQDIAEAVRMLLRLSPACVVPEIIFQRPGRRRERSAGQRRLRRRRCRATAASRSRRAAPRARQYRLVVVVAAPTASTAARSARAASARARSRRSGARSASSPPRRGSSRLAVTGSPGPARAPPVAAAARRAPARAAGALAAGHQPQVLGPRGGQRRPSGASSASRLASRWALRISSSRSVARRARCERESRNANRSQAWANEITLVRPPARWAASIGQMPSSVA